MRHGFRTIVILGTLASLTTGCATTGGSCQMNSEGKCGRTEVVNAAIGLGVLVVLGGGYLLVREVSRSMSAKPAATPEDRPLVGHVRWRRSAEAVPSVRVTLRHADGPVLETTTTQSDGGFTLRFPRKADFYTLAVDAEQAEGETVLWLQDHPPAPLDLLVLPRAAHVPWGMRQGEQR